MNQLNGYYDEILKALHDADSYVRVVRANEFGPCRADVQEPCEGRACVSKSEVD
jgi:hypothetical protein